jgi:hypothetical protein
LALATDGRRLAAAIGGALALWELGAGRARLADQRRMGGAPAHHLAFAPDSRAIVALQGAEARVWRLDDEGIAPEPVACAHGGRVMDALVIGERLVTAGEDGVVRVWGVSTSDKW